MPEVSSGVAVDGDDEATARFRSRRGGEELVVEDQQLPGLAVDVEDGEDEIGRASCRERVLRLV